MEKRRLYAAYGSNMNLEQMARRCPTAKVVNYGFIEGYKLIFRGAPYNAYATIEPTEVEGDRYGATKVVVWELKESDEQALDRYEGYPVFYRKEHMQVHTFEDEYIDDDKEVEANTLAGEILLPRNTFTALFKTAMKEKSLQETKKALSEVFDVSLAVIDARIKYLKLENDINRN